MRISDWSSDVCSSDLDPERMQIYGVSVQEVIEAVQEANDEAGGAVIERAEAEYMVTVGGYLEDLDDFRNIPLSVSEGGTPVTVGDVARVQIVPDFRRGIAEQIGRASGRERVCQYVSIPVVPGSLKKKETHAHTTKTPHRYAPY